MFGGVREPPAQLFGRPAMHEVAECALGWCQVAGLSIPFFVPLAGNCDTNPLSRPWVRACSSSLGKRRPASRRARLLAWKSCWSLTRWLNTAIGSFYVAHLCCFTSSPLAIRIVVVLTNALCPRSLEKSLCVSNVRRNIIFFFSVPPLYLYVLHDLTWLGVLLGSGIE